MPQLTGLPERSQQFRTSSFQCWRNMKAFENFWQAFEDLSASMPQRPALKTARESATL